VIRENKISLSVIPDPLFFLFVNSARELPCTTLECSSQVIGLETSGGHKCKSNQGKWSINILFNACVAHGGWVLELPTPTQVARAPQKPALPATSHEPRQPNPAPAQAPVTQSQKLRGNNDNRNNQ